MADTAEGTSGATSKVAQNTELLQRVQYLESCLQSVTEERAAELALALRELCSVSETAEKQTKE